MNKDRDVNLLLESINNELKSYILGYALSRKEPKTIGELHNESNETLEIKLTETDFRSHCDERHSHSKIDNFIDKDYSDGERKCLLNDFAIETEIDLIAQYFLAMTNKYGFSMMKFFGHATKNSPKNSVDMLRIISFKGKLQKKYLVEELKIAEGTIFDNINKFKKLNLIEYSSIRMNKKGQIFYQISNGKIKDYHKLVEELSLDAKKVFNQLMCKSGQNYVEITEKIGLTKKRTRSAITELKNSNLIEQLENDWKQHEKYSTLEITEKGLDFIQDLNLVLNFYSTSRKKNKKHVQKFIRKYENINNSLKIYLSSKPIKKSLEERKQDVLNYLSEFGETTYKTMRTEIDLKDQKPLRSLIDAGFIEKVGRGVYRTIENKKLN